MIGDNYDFYQRLISQTRHNKIVFINPWERDRFTIYWIFYDHLSAHSLLAKLGRWGWLMRMKLAWQKSKKTLDISKDYIELRRPEALGVREKDLIPTLPLLGLRTRGNAGASRLKVKAPGGGGGGSGQVVPTTGYLIVVPPVTWSKGEK